LGSSGIELLIDGAGEIFGHWNLPFKVAISLSRWRQF
jgi:hypothetical protein